MKVNITIKEKSISEKVQERQFSTDSSKGIYYQSKSESRSILSNCLQPHRLYNPWNSPGQNIRLSSLSILQGIFPTQGSNPGLPYCRQIPYQLSHKGSPPLKIGQKILCFLDHITTYLNHLGVVTVSDYFINTTLE